jgi:hypothetical protein
MAQTWETRTVPNCNTQNKQKAIKIDFGLLYCSMPNSGDFSICGKFSGKKSLFYAQA